MQKPISCVPFLTEFVNETKCLQKDGFVFGNKFTVTISKILCDAPAKSIILGIKSHDSYFGCTKCTTEGTFLKNRMNYPQVDATLRTDE